jgi:hypothetical protein
MSSEQSRGWRGVVGRAWFVVVPLVGLVELVLLGRQTRDVVSADDWQRTRSWLESHVSAADLVAVSPGWQDPVARSRLGGSLLSASRAARSEERIYPRAFEVSFGGARSPGLTGWRETGREDFGRLTVRTLENPAPAKVIDDVLDHVGKASMTVEHGDGGRLCGFTKGSAGTGGLGFGAAIPGERYDCGDGALAGITILPDLDYEPRQCVLVPPGGGVVRLRVGGFHFAKSLHGYHGLYAEHERNREGQPVTLVFKHDGETLGRFVHKDGDGWKVFEAPTDGLAGKEGELMIEITSPQRRHYCFRADSR